jgi:o-succinylbenzoate---CoA ligase
MKFEPWLTRAARLHPERRAIDTPPGGCTYAELNVAAVNAAAWLGDRGVAPGDLVAVALAPGVDFAATLHGAWRLGACVMPVDLRGGAAERAAVTAGAHTVVDEPIAPDAGSRGWSGFGPEPEVDEAAHALVIHTSGSTGTPRPIALSFDNLLWSALGSAVALGLDAEERWLCTLPLSHVGGLSILVRSAIHGTTAVLRDSFDTDVVLTELARSDGPTLVSLVPTMLARLLDAGLERPGRLRCALIGGGPLAPALVERAREAGLPLSQTYGLTEACSQVTTAPPHDERIRPGSDAGPPLFCTRVELSSQHEILVRGPTVARAALAPDGWLHTGDLGELDDEGRLRVTGRIADTIVTGGENVAPAEIEGVLLEHPSVADAAVHGVPDPEWGEAVVAAVVLAPEMRAGEDELRRHCAGRLAGYKVPKQVRFVSSLPRTPSGKLRRRELV